MLQSQRDAFWDTMPSFEGRKEVWQALRMACDADDLGTAQAIIDSSKIQLPTGLLTDGCYDELGNRYVLPTYVISLPENLSESSLSQASAVKEIAEPADLGSEFGVVFRLSVGSDAKTTIFQNESFGRIKKRLYEVAGLKSSESKIKIIYLGKILDDSVIVKNISSLKEGSVIQVMIIPN